MNQILVRIAVIEESVVAGKYLAAAMTAALVGQFVLAWFRDSPAALRRRRQDEDDSGEVDTSHVRHRR